MCCRVTRTDWKIMTSEEGWRFIDLGEVKHLKQFGHLRGHLKIFKMGNFVGISDYYADQDYLGGKGLDW